MRSRLLTLFPRALVVASALLCVAAQAQTYRWVDKDGTVHYSDRPQPGAERVQLPKAQTYSAPPPTSVRSSLPRNAGRPAPVTCSISSPAPEQAFVNENSVTVSFRGPAGFTPLLLLNGVRQDAQGAGAGFVISPIARGSYQVAVIFANPTSGVEACRTASVTFHVRQASLLSPARPRGPGVVPSAPGTRRPAN